MAPNRLGHFGIELGFSFIGKKLHRIERINRTKNHLNPAFDTTGKSPMPRDDEIDHTLPYSA